MQQMAIRTTRLVLRNDYVPPKKTTTASISHWFFDEPDDDELTFNVEIIRSSNILLKKGDRNDRIYIDVLNQTASAYFAYQRLCRGRRQGKGSF